MLLNDIYNLFKGFYEFFAFLEGVVQIERCADAALQVMGIEPGMDAMRS